MTTFDARDWAADFKKHFPDADEELMLGWFANALMRGWDEHAHRYPTAYRLRLLRDITGDPTMHAAPYVTRDSVDGETRQVVWWRVARFVATPDVPWSIGRVAHIEIPDPNPNCGGTYLAGPTELEAINDAIKFFDADLLTLKEAP